MHGALINDAYLGSGELDLTFKYCIQIFISCIFLVLLSYLDQKIEELENKAWVSLIAFQLKNFSISAESFLLSVVEMLGN